MRCLATRYTELIWSAFDPITVRIFVGISQMTEYMRICDTEMEACRQTIEWNFGKNQNIFSICKDPYQYKLRKQNPYTLEMFCVTHLMTNMYNCVNGEILSGYGKFDCDPPKLEKYLAL